MSADQPLIHIGYHKTGTTWLQRQVFNDNNLGFSEVWPPDVLERTFIGVNPFTFDANAARATVAPFASAGTKLVVSHERLSGAPLGGGSDSRAIADRLHETFPNGSVLIVVRDQRDMLISVYKQITTKGLNRDSFDRFLEHRVEIGRSSPVLEFLEYDHLIAYYQSTFGADRVLVLAYEQLSDSIEFVGRIAKFVGLPQPSDVTRTRENVGLPTASIAVLRYLNIAARIVGVDRMLVGPSARPRMVNARLKFVQRVGRLAPKSTSKNIETKWHDKAAALLGDRLAASNARTAELTGLDLGALGYVMPH